MKKLLLFGLALLILTAARSNPAELGPSYYYSRDYAHPLDNGVPTRLTAWSPQQEAVVMLESDTFHPQSYGGLLHVSGMCELKRPAERFTLKLVTNNGTTIMSVFPLYDGNGIASYSVAFPAAPFYLEAMQESGRANRARCVVLVEAVR